LEYINWVHGVRTRLQIRGRVLHNIYTIVDSGVIRVTSITMSRWFQCHSTCKEVDVMLNNVGSVNLIKSKVILYLDQNVSDIQYTTKRYTVLEI
jgi:hypothetical protein